MAKNRTKAQRAKILKEKICPFQFYKIDENNLLQFGEDLIDPDLTKPPAGYVALPPPDGMYQPKWNGTDWEDVGTPPDVELPPQLPTIEALVAEIQVLREEVAALRQEVKK